MNPYIAGLLIAFGLFAVICAVLAWCATCAGRQDDGGEG